MAEISRRRPDQFGYLMTVLKLSTVNLDNRAGILEQRLGRRFYSARLTRPRGAEEEKVSNGPSGSSQAAEIHLIDADNFPNCFLLSDERLHRLVSSSNASRAVLVGSSGTFVRPIFLPSLSLAPHA